MAQSEWGKFAFDVFQEKVHDTHPDIPALNWDYVTTEVRAYWQAVADAILEAS